MGIDKLENALGTGLVTAQNASTKKLFIRDFDNPIEFRHNVNKLKIIEKRMQKTFPNISVNANKIEMLRDRVVALEAEIEKHTKSISELQQSNLKLKNEFKNDLELRRQIKDKIQKIVQNEQEFIILGGIHMNYVIFCKQMAAIYNVQNRNFVFKPIYAHNILYLNHFFDLYTNNSSFESTSDKMLVEDWIKAALKHLSSTTISQLQNSYLTMTVLQRGLQKYAYSLELWALVVEIAQYLLQDNQASELFEKAYSHTKSVYIKWCQYQWNRDTFILHKILEDYSGVPSFDDSLMLASVLVQIILNDSDGIKFAKKISTTSSILFKLRPLHHCIVVLVAITMAAFGRIPSKLFCDSPHHFVISPTVFLINWSLLNSIPDWDFISSMFRFALAYFVTGQWTEIIQVLVLNYVGFLKIRGLNSTEIISQVWFELVILDHRPEIRLLRVMIADMLGIDDNCLYDFTPTCAAEWLVLVDIADSRKAGISRLIAANYPKSFSFGEFLEALEADYGGDFYLDILKARLRSISDNFSIDNTTNSKTSDGILEDKEALANGFLEESYRVIFADSSFENSSKSSIQDFEMKDSIAENYLENNIDRRDSLWTPSQSILWWQTLTKYVFDTHYCQNRYKEALQTLVTPKPFEKFTFPFGNGLPKQFMTTQYRDVSVVCEQIKGDSLLPINHDFARYAPARVIQALPLNDEQWSVLFSQALERRLGCMELWQMAINGAGGGRTCEGDAISELASKFVQKEELEYLKLI